MKLFKKIKLFFLYLKLIKLNKETLNNYNIRIDRTKRLYTVFQIEDSEAIDVYGKRFFDIKFEEFKIGIENLFFNLNLAEIIALYEIKKIDNNNYLLIFSYSGFNSYNFYRLIILFLISILIGLNIYLFI